MVAAIISIILALISYFGAKKSGASDGEAALAGAAVGAGSYYVATQTEWGKDSISSIKEWVGLTDEDDAPVLEADGTQAKVPEGAEVLRNEDGSVKRDSSGNIMWKLVDSTGKVLTSWGGVGTAAVVGTAAAALDDDLPSWVLPVGLGVAAMVLLSK